MSRLIRRKLPEGIVDRPAGKCVTNRQRRRQALVEVPVSVSVESVSLVPVHRRSGLLLWKLSAESTKHYDMIERRK